MAIQIGRKKQVPIYSETTTIGEVLSSSTLSNYFTITQGSTYGWSYNVYSGSDVGLIEFKPDNVGINSSTATITFEAVRDLPDIRIDYVYYTESNYDKITVTMGSETLLNAVSGVAGPSNPASGSTLENLIMNRAISAGTTITFKYVKDPSQSHTYESYTKFTIQCLPYTTTTTEITGYEEKLLPQTISNIYLSPTKKVIGGWIKDSTAARQFYYNSVLQYTGNYTVSTITIGSTNYDLYTLTSTGVLTLPKEGQVWACGGGGGGANGYISSSKRYAGGGGGGGYVLEATTLQKGKYNIVIGAGGAGSSSGGTTSIGAYSANGGGSKTTVASHNGGSGGSGGGQSVYKDGTGNNDGVPGTGAGVSTYPFGITDLKAHCAGGGGGSVYGLNGTDGGTNGSDGKTTYSGVPASPSYIFYGGVGGEYGGGTGGTGYDSTRYATDGSPATFYGSGVGGAGLAGTGSSSYKTYSGGSGYQGVAYILIQK